MYAGQDRKDASLPRLNTRLSSLAAGLALAALVAIPWSAHAEGTVVSVCGEVTEYTPPSSAQSGTITMDGDVFTLAPGAQVVGGIGAGSESCLTFVFDSSGQISGVSDDSFVEEEAEATAEPAPTSTPEPIPTEAPAPTATLAPEPTTAPENTEDERGAIPSGMPSEEESAPAPVVPTEAPVEEVAEETENERADAEPREETQPAEDPDERLAIVDDAGDPETVGAEGEDADLPRTGGAAPAGRLYSVVSVAVAALAGFGVFSTRRNA